MRPGRRSTAFKLGNHRGATGTRDRGETLFFGIVSRAGVVRICWLARMTNADCPDR